MGVERRASWTVPMFGTRITPTEPGSELFIVHLRQDPIPPRTTKDELSYDAEDVKRISVSTANGTTFPRLTPGAEFLKGGDYHLTTMFFSVPIGLPVTSLSFLGTRFDVSGAKVGSRSELIHAQEPTEASAPAAVGSAPAESTPEARALMARAVEALGGASKVQSVKAIRYRAVSRSNTSPREMEVETTTAYPDRRHARFQSSMGEVVLAVTPGGGFLITPNATQDLESSKRDDVLRSIKFDLVYVAQHASDPAYVFTLADSTKVGGVEAKVVAIRGGGVEMTWAIDPSSGRVLRSTFTLQGGEQRTDFTDWRPVAGLTLPFHHIIARGSVVMATEDISRVDINPELDFKLFQKPEN